MQGFLRSYKGWDRYKRNTFIADTVADPQVVRCRMWSLLHPRPRLICASALNAHMHNSLSDLSSHPASPQTCDVFQRLLLEVPQTIQRLRMLDKGTAVIDWRLQVRQAMRRLTLCDFSCIAHLQHRGSSVLYGLSPPQAAHLQHNDVRMPTAGRSFYFSEREEVYGWT